MADLWAHGGRRPSGVPRTRGSHTARTTAGASGCGATPSRRRQPDEQRGRGASHRTVRSGRVR